MRFWKKHKDLGADKLGLGSKNQFLPMWRCKNKKCRKTFDAPKPKGFFGKARCPHCGSEEIERVY